MNIAQAHLDIAKERFLELMVEDPKRDIGAAVDLAIMQANIFDEKYRQTSYGYVPQALAYGEVVSQQKKMKGCKACFGSGGKVGMPCQICGGSGKVPA